MSNPPLLSIVTPTKGHFDAEWLDRLLAVQGEVQFILVYPPGASIHPISDPRVTLLTSPFKGEVMQRLIGLFNAKGTYVLALDDDDYVHPDVVPLIRQYFDRFPQSWVLRLKSENIDYSNQPRIRQAWEPIPSISDLPVVQKRGPKGEVSLLELPIAPLQNKFDIRHAIWPIIPRRDMHGIHMENFTNRVWKNELIQQALPQLVETMRLLGPLTWIPFWNLDRLMGLFLQAQAFQPDLIIGHWLSGPEQIRYIITPAGPKYWRLMVHADALLLKQFPQYGYFWNLFFNQLWEIPKLALGQVKQAFQKSRSLSG